MNLPTMVAGQRAACANPQKSLRVFRKRCSRMTRSLLERAADLAEQARQREVARVQ